MIGQYLVSSSWNKQQKTLFFFKMAAQKCHWEVEGKGMVVTYLRTICWRRISGHTDIRIQIYGLPITETEEVQIVLWRESCFKPNLNQSLVNCLIHHLHRFVLQKLKNNSRLMNAITKY